MLGNEHLVDAQWDRARILEPEDLEVLDRLRHAQGIGQVVVHVAIDANLEVLAHGLADGAASFDDVIDLLERERTVPDIGCVISGHVVDVELDLREPRLRGIATHLAPSVELVDMFGRRSVQTTWR